MLLQRFDVGQGAIACFVMGSLLLASACSGDSNVSFDDSLGSSGGDATSAGSKLNGAGAEQSGGSSADSGSGQGGKTNGTSGNGNAGNPAAGSGGTASSAGNDTGGSNTAGSNTGGMAGSVSSGGKGGRGGNGGAAGSSGSSNAGMAGMSGGGGSGGSEGCTAASFGGHDYYFCGIVDSALLAANQCQSLGMSMVSIESEAENSFVLDKQEGSSWWIWASTGTTFWNGGSPPVGKAIPGVYENFLEGQPNDNNADGFHENCVGLTANGWNDLLCTLGGFRAACESTP